MQHVSSIRAVTDINAVEATAPKTTTVINPFADLPNLASANAGARVLFATDEWFARADNLIQDSEPHFDPDAYCTQGKVMDGWESRRRREAGHDWCIVKLAAKAELVGVQLDTAFFMGNNAPAVSLQVANLTCAEESALVSQFPRALERLLHGGVQGTGCTPEEVQQAEAACWT